MNGRCCGIGCEILCLRSVDLFPFLAGKKETWEKKKKEKRKKRKKNAGRFSFVSVFQFVFVVVRDF